MPFDQVGQCICSLPQICPSIKVFADSCALFELYGPAADCIKRSSEPMYINNGQLESMSPKETCKCGLHKQGVTPGPYSGSFMSPLFMGGAIFWGFKILDVLKN